ncbi:trafficking protein particle complex subunit 6B [Anopheles darlingi]|uniref:Trafficking protein particle complex subunit 6B n=2 Tax=Anopheles darlingi TaxID=43151 RepID=W5JQ82_ANODA|nr:trafficking protein particle complex subunit 6B [Anopheles darlingi]
MHFHRAYIYLRERPPPPNQPAESNTAVSMAEEAIFEFLHSEIVNYTLNKEHGKEKDLSTLEFMGYTTGYRIIERLTREWPRFKDELDTMKFICTDFWSSIYRKQIDNLRTNHQGVYVLQDNAFRFLTRLSAGSQYLEHAPKFVAYTCGLVRGSLANLGITSTVTAEVQTMPSCKFHIQVNRT